MYQIWNIEEHPTSIVAMSNIIVKQHAVVKGREPIEMLIRIMNQNEWKLSAPPNGGNCLPFPNERISFIELDSKVVIYDSFSFPPD